MARRPRFPGFARGATAIVPYEAISSVSPVLVDDALYQGDNGRLLCGRCSGASARYTGRDLSGHRVHRLTAEDLDTWLLSVETPPSCEHCRRTLDRRGVVS